MYLKSLTIKGFKSFAERQAINFEPGVAVIVGPNGSGKSNISEAITWALGESSPRNLRVGSMEEIIFGGSAAKKAVSLAEVELVLDNSDGTLPVEFSQVSIMRRMYRSGESEYFINKAPCRRRDVTDILFDSGLGQDMSSVIGQGALTEVLDSKPADRVTLLEDAAGILKHRKRKEKALRKLDRMDVTLTRVDDIVKMIDKQLRPLERQAKRAEQYHKLQSQLKDLDLGVAVAELRGLQEQFNRLDKQKREVDGELEIAQLKVNEKEGALEKRQLALEKRGLFVGDINEQRMRLRSVVERLDSLMLLLEEKGKNMVSRLSELRAGVHGASARLQSLRSELASLDQQQSDSAAELDALTAEYQAKNRASEEATKQASAAQASYAKLSNALKGRQSQLETARANLSKTAEALSGLDLEGNLLNDQLEQINANYSQSQALLAEKRQKADKLTAELIEQQQKSNSLRASIDKFVRILDDLKPKLSQTTKQQAEVSAQIRGLEEIERAYVTSSPALTWTLDNRSQWPGLKGQFSQQVKVKSKLKLPFGMQAKTLEGLVEQLLGSDFFGLFVDDSHTAQDIAKKLSASKIDQGALSVFPLKGMRGFDEQSIRGERLLDYLEIDKPYQAAVEALLGDVYLAADPSEAYKYYLRDRLGVRFVTPQGFIVWPSGKMTFGSSQTDVEGVVARRRKLDVLSKDAERLDTQVGDLELQVSKSEANLKSTQQDDFEVSQQVAKLQGDLDAASAEVDRITENLAQTLANQQDCQRKLADVQQRKDKTAPLTAEYTQRIQELETQCSDFESQVKQASAGLLELSDAKAASVQTLSALKVELDGKRSSLIYAKNRRLTVEKDIAELEQNIDTSSATVRSLGVMQNRIDPLYRQFDILRQGGQAYASELLKQAELEQSDSSNLRQLIKQADAAAKQARQELSEVGEQRTLVMVDLAKVEENVQAQVAKISEEHQTTVEAALGVKAPTDLAEARGAADRLRHKLASLGAVNQVAEQEYQNLKERREFINEQVEDLRQSRKALAKISNALDRKLHNAFIDVFNQVNKNFSEVFEALFPGGSGELILSEGDAEEEMGIEVSAQPKGKHISKLSLMSGGEKSLTAIAMLFAIYQVRKVPFYVLDEVEAALDDSNLQRLLAYVDVLRKTSQIIMISHQRRTMEQADILYGVSMQANSISKVISQRLDEALKYAQDA
ncbi:MAG: chromosome segregation protein SMC [Coriobacteriales bacterium]|jgi:chromosome segregation protein|nr:chromosome segregation protein SMC [Coriobacteriales bacterium]